MNKISNFILFKKYMAVKLQNYIFPAMTKNTTQVSGNKATKFLPIEK